MEGKHLEVSNIAAIHIKFGAVIEKIFSLKISTHSQRAWYPTCTDSFWQIWSIISSCHAKTDLIWLMIGYSCWWRLPPRRNLIHSDLFWLIWSVMPNCHVKSHANPFVKPLVSTVKPYVKSHALSSNLLKWGRAIAPNRVCMWRSAKCARHMVTTTFDLRTLRYRLK